MGDLKARFTAILDGYAERAPASYGGCDVAIMGVTKIRSAIDLSGKGGSPAEMTALIQQGIQHIKVGLSIITVDPDFKSRGVSSYFNAQIWLGEQLLAAMTAS
jgi:hypothetical protein